MQVKLEEALKMVDEKRIIQLASDVIKIPSITGDEKKVMEHVKGLLEEMRQRRHQKLWLKLKTSPHLQYNTTSLTF